MTDTPLTPSRTGTCPACDRTGTLTIDLAAGLLHADHASAPKHCAVSLPADRLLTIEQAAAWSGLTPIAIYKSIERHTLAATVLTVAPSRRFIAIDDLIAFWQRSNPVGWRKGRTRKPIAA